MARPSVKPPKLKDGFYLEINNSGASGRGIKIQRDTKEEIDLAIKQYSKISKVTYLGQIKDGKFI